MRGLTRRWVWSSDDSSGTGESLLDRLLRIRGVSSAAEIDRFLNPSWSHLHDLGAMHDLTAAAEHLVEAVRAGRRIAIYGDYDVDGVSASALLWRVLRLARPEQPPRIFIPHRIDDGYGLNTERLLELRREGIDLVVTVDCGITAIEPVRAARDAGLEVIITDHHDLALDDAGRPVLPDANLVVHPRHPAASYPFGELCGAGVAFKLAWQFARTWCGSDRVADVFRKELVDATALVALATIADIVPLLDENRVLAFVGLRRLGQAPSPGVRALVEHADQFGKGPLDGEKVGFRLAPVLNACGRLGHAGEAVRLFTTADASEAEGIVRELAKQNEARRRIEQRIFEQACSLAEARGMTRPDRPAIVLAHPDWHPGVVGIVCSRLVDRFGRPTVLMGVENGLARGSARSVEGYSILEGLQASRRLMKSCGGHAAAAGLSLEEASVEVLAQELAGHVAARLAPEDLVQAIRIDGNASIGEIDRDAVREIERLQPFGRGNPAPKLRLASVRVAAPPRVFGTRGEHLELRVADDSTRPPRFLRAVWWRAVAHREALRQGTVIDLVVEPQVDAFRGRDEVIGRVHDARVVEPLNARSPATAAAAAV